MITKQEMDKILTEVNRVLANLNERISKLEKSVVVPEVEYSDTPQKVGRPKKST